ncbi:hypothetical protein ACVWZK_009440 [Bradyrhizobium sp. GM0.4]
MSPRQRKTASKVIRTDLLGEIVLGRMLALARRVLDQKQHQRGPKVYSLHAPEVECIGKGKAHRSGHNAPPDYRFRVFTSGQKRRVTPKIKRELRRRSAVEPVIGHLKSEHRMGRNYLWHPQGDATNAVLAAAGYNFQRLLRWLQLLLRQILVQLFLRLQFVPS